MKVAMYYNNRDIRLEEYPTPEIKDDEVLLKVEASGICGSDIMEWYRLHKAPLVLGHEVAGTVEAAGRNVTKVSKGDRIAVAHHVPCNTCHYCLKGHQTVCDTLRTTNFYPGGFAEYLRVPAANLERGVFKLPDNVSFEEGTFVEPLACVLRGQRAAGIQPGDTVLVLGSGIAGLLHIRTAKALGAALVVATDVSEYRLIKAKEMGADHALDATSDVKAVLMEITGGFLADVVIICTGADAAIEQALQCVDKGGSVLFFAPSNTEVGLPVSLNSIFWRNEITLTSSYAGDQADHEQALKLIAGGVVKVEDMITHRLPLSQTQEGFGMVIDGSSSVKVIIEPHA